MWQKGCQRRRDFAWVGLAAVTQATPTDRRHVSMKCDMFWIFNMEAGWGMGKRHPTHHKTSNNCEFRCGPGTGSQKEDCEGSDSTGRATCPNARRWFQEFFNRVPKWTSPWKQDSTIYIYILVFHSIPWHNDSTSCRIDHIFLHSCVTSNMPIFEETPTMQLPGLPSTAILDGKKSESQGLWFL